MGNWVWLVISRYFGGRMSVVVGRIAAIAA